MDPALPVSDWILAAEIGLALALVAVSAVVSAAEAALFSLPPDVRARLADAASPDARRLGRLAVQPRAVLLSMRLVDTLSNVGAIVLAAHAAGHVRAMRAPVGMDASWGATWAPIAIAFVATVLVLLVVGEALPRLIGARAPEAVIRRVGGVVAVLHRLAGPLTRPLARWSNRVEQRLGEAQPLTADDLKVMAEIAESEGTLDGDERSLIEAVVDFGETTVREIMTARADVVALPMTASFADAAALVRESGHSRLPVVDGTLDRVVGLLVAKDLLAVAGLEDGPDGAPFPHVVSFPDRANLPGAAHVLPSDDAAPASPLAPLLRTPFFVPDSLRLDDLMEEFRTRRTHVALVVDEYGETVGLVTMEDLLEEVVGEIRDERDTDERPDLTLLPDGTYRLDARVNLDDLSDDLALDLPLADYDFDTVAGLILHLCGRMPTVGETVEDGRLRLTVESMDGLRIGAVHLALIDPDPPSDATDEAG